MPRTQDGLSKNYLPSITNKPDSNSDFLKIVEISKSIAFSGLKGQWDEHLRKAGSVITVDGRELYTALTLSAHVSMDFFNKGTKGWHTAEALRILGLDNDDLTDIQRTAFTKDVNGYFQYYNWKREISALEFTYQVNRLNDMLVDVDTIEIDYELQAYNPDVYTTDADRPYNSKASIFSDVLLWKQTLTTDMFDVEFGASNNPDIINKTSEQLLGKSIRLFTGTTDVTSSFTTESLTAIRAMIAYSGTTFMDKLSASKTSEGTLTIPDIQTVEYITAIGTEVFDANIKSDFLLDEEEIYYRFYTENSYGNEVDLGIDDERKLFTDIAIDSKGYYASRFWDFTKLIIDEEQYQLHIDKQDDWIMYDTRTGYGAYIYVDEFMKLDVDEFSYIMNKYLDFRLDVEEGSFFDNLLTSVARLVSTVFSVAYDLFSTIPTFKQQLDIITSVVNSLFGTDMTNEEVFNVGLNVGILVATMGLSSEVQVAQFTAITLASVGLITTQVGVMTAYYTTLATLSALTIGQKIMDAGDKSDEKKQAELDEATKEKEAIEAKEKEREEAEKAKREQEITFEEEKEKSEFTLFLQDPVYELKRDLLKIRTNDVGIQVKQIKRIGKEVTV